MSVTHVCLVISRTICVYGQLAIGTKRASQPVPRVLLIDLMNVNALLILYSAWDALVPWVNMSSSIYRV